MTQTDLPGCGPLLGSSLDDSDAIASAAQETACFWAGLVCCYSARAQKQCAHIHVRIVRQIHLLVVAIGFLFIVEDLCAQLVLMV